MLPSCGASCCYFHRRSSRARGERPRGELDGGGEADGPASCMYLLYRRTAIEMYTAGAAAAATTATTATTTTTAAAAAAAAAAAITTNHSMV